MRTRKEVRQFLESRIGTAPVDKSNAALNGQCVALIKDLMNFLGVPNPYAARGHAKDVGNSYIAQGIGTASRGWLTICVNRNMGGGYGHVWVDLLNEANYESNGAIPLRVTKNTIAVQNAQQFVNFDKWIKEESMARRIVNASNWRWRFQRLHRQLVGNWDMSEKTFQAIVGQDPWTVVESWSDHPNADQATADQALGERARVDKWQKQITDLQKKVNELSARPTKAELDALKKQSDKLAEDAEKAKLEAKQTEQAMEEIRKQQAQADAEAQSFITSVINAVRNLFKRS